MKYTKEYLKEKWKIIPKHTKIYTAIMFFILLCGIGFGIMAMYMCGYTLFSWLEKFYGWLLLIVAVLASLVFTYYFVVKKGGIRK